ncbi:germin-like protein subfamily 2 member 1 [Cryptomeria japonica]|uniref:germin-like protein subfamily 2 member 1 n=1 Tax=Cryptomeria japonica TaxID=3369 RepID=UPI0025AD81CF|nr:germin-like protein subfamily 2 member 1 [Cryptomeria japonica]XP_057846770.1 germin-like protein subfamily 2 member 1 [Cryptomeria japonica]
MNSKAEKAVINGLLWLSLLTAMVIASDPDLLQDFCVADVSKGAVKVNGFVCKDPKKVKPSDFLFKGLRKPGLTNNTFSGKVTSGNVQSFPGLNTLGISMNRVDLAPGGINPPHTHPRATEIVYLMKGTILAAFIGTDNVFYSQKMKKGDVFVIPRGLVHFQQNIGSSNAVAITAFNSQLPGAQVLPLTLFGSSPAIPEEVLAKAFQISKKEVKEISSKFTPS